MTYSYSNLNRPIRTRGVGKVWGFFAAMFFILSFFCVVGCAVMIIPMSAGSEHRDVTGSVIVGLGFCTVFVWLPTVAILAWPFVVRRRVDRGPR